MERFVETVSSSLTNQGQERIMGRLRRRLNRKKNAALLLEVEEMQARAPLQIKREVSLETVATDIWNELSRAFDGSTKGKEVATPTLDNAGKRLDEAWRRDALRALHALERAPEALTNEVRRQRLAKLQPELKLLGLHRRRLQTLTEADVREARQRRAKDLHPDLRLSRMTQREKRGGMLGGFFGPSSAPVEEPEDFDAMAKLNVAYTKVRRALTAPPFDWKSM